MCVLIKECRRYIAKTTHQIVGKPKAEGFQRRSKRMEVNHVFTSERGEAQRSWSEEAWATEEDPPERADGDDLGAAGQRRAQ